MRLSEYIDILSSIDNSDAIISSIKTRESVPSGNISACLQMTNRFYYHIIYVNNTVQQTGFQISMYRM